MSSDSPPAPVKRLHGLDGLRALASLLVLAHHLGAPRLAWVVRAKGHAALAFFMDTLGASGVELFFVLSGAVLARPYLSGKRRFRVAEYASRRSARLFPPYLAAWLVTGFAFYLNPWQGSFHLQDWLRQVGIVHFGLHYAWAWWSLTTELAFYFLIPLLIPALLFLPRRLEIDLGLLASICVLAVMLPALPHFATFAPHELSALVIYAPCFVAGLLLAATSFPTPCAYAFSAIGGALLLWVAFRGSASDSLPHVGYALLYTGIVAQALVPESTLARQLSRWHLVWLGERSYSLFLIHCAAIMLVGAGAARLGAGHGAQARLLVALSSAACSLFGAMLLFSGVERRFARGLLTSTYFWPWKPVEIEATLPTEVLQVKFTLEPILEPGTELGEEAKPI